MEMCGGRQLSQRGQFFRSLNLLHSSMVDDGNRSKRFELESKMSIAHHVKS